MKRIPFFLLAVVAACGGSETGVSHGHDLGVGAQELEMQGAKVHYMKGARSGGGGGTSNLIDHGGPVLPTSRAYAIYWGTNQTALPSDLKSGVAAFFNGITGTSYATIGAQYNRGAGNEVTSLVASANDATPSPTRGPSTSTVVTEACNTINANKWTVDSSAIYFLFADNMPGHTSYCAYHTWGTCNGTPVQVAYMPNTTGVAGCDPGDLYSCNSYSQGTRSIMNVTSHEWYEAVTDPQGNGWTDSSGSEIGDKCAWQFSSCVNLAGSNWQLQKEWSNAISGCQQQ